MQQKNGWKIIGAVGAAGFCWHQNKALTVTSLTVTVGLTQPLKLVQLSDLHGANFGYHNRRLLEKVAALKPDLIVFTGDLINSRGKHLAKMVDLMGALHGVAPVYAIPGNHDHNSGKFEELVAHLRQEGIHVLLNELVRLLVNGQQVNLLGLDENQDSRGAYHAFQQGNNVYTDNTPLLSTLAAQNGLRVVLSHFPENFALSGHKAYAHQDFDLMLAGHTHGGQFRLPKIGGLYAPGQGILPRYAGGVYGNKAKLIVSRGLGNSTFPLRLFNRPEIVNLTVI